MSDDHESDWLRHQMRRLRQRRNASATPFHQVWNAARAQHLSSDAKLAWPWWRIAGASIAAVVVAAVATFHTATERMHSRQKEQEFATVDGILITYWQAPSDDLLPAGQEDGVTKPR